MLHLRHFVYPVPPLPFPLRQTTKNSAQAPKCLEGCKIIDPFLSSSLLSGFVIPLIMQLEGGASSLIDAWESLPAGQPWMQIITQVCKQKHAWKGRAMIIISFKVINCWKLICEFMLLLRINKSIAYMGCNLEEFEAHLYACDLALISFK